MPLTPYKTYPTFGIPATPESTAHEAFMHAPAPGLPFGRHRYPKNQWMPFAIDGEPWRGPDPTKPNLGIPTRSAVLTLDNPFGVPMDPALLPRGGGAAPAATSAKFGMPSGGSKPRSQIDAHIPQRDRSAAGTGFGRNPMAAGNLWSGPSEAEVKGLNFGGARETGGPMDPNKAYLVGERGPELVVPQAPATVVPADRTQEYIDKIGKAATEARLREADRLRQMTPAPQNDPAAMPQQTPMIFGVGRPPDTGAPDRITSMPFGPPANKPVSQPWDSPMLFGAPPEVAAPPAPAVPTLEDMRFRGLAARARLDNARYDEMRFGRPDSDFPQPHTGATPPPRNGTIFDLGQKPPQTAVPNYVEQNMRGLNGSQKRAVRNQAGMQMGQQQFQEELSLDKQAKAAVGAWEAAKATRETMGLPPISPELDKQFWNGNVQKQLAMVQQMGILTDEHLRQKHGTQQQEQRQAETADERAYREKLTADERAYDEKRREMESVTGLDFIQGEGGFIPVVRTKAGSTKMAGGFMPNRAQLTPEHIAQLNKIGATVTHGPNGTTVKYGPEKPAKPGTQLFWDPRNSKVIEVPDDVQPPASAGLQPMKRKTPGAPQAGAAAAKGKYFQ